MLALQKCHKKGDCAGIRIGIEFPNPHSLWQPSKYDIICFHICIPVKTITMKNLSRPLKWAQKKRCPGLGTALWSGAAMLHLLFLRKRKVEVLSLRSTCWRIMHPIGVRSALQRDGEMSGRELKARSGPWRRKILGHTSFMVWMLAEIAH